MMMDVESGYAFIERKDMTSVYEVTDSFNLPRTAYDHFMNYNDEVLYLLKDGKLEGVLSIGDLERFYSQQKRCKLKINRNYTSAKDVDFKAASVFFERTKTINEMPVVTDGKELIGVIRKEKKEKIRKKQKNSLTEAKYPESEWHRNELIRFINHTKAKVFLYHTESSTIGRYLGDNGKMILKKRCKRRGETYLRGLSDKEWVQFIGETEYGPEIVDVMKKNLGSCVPILSKGVVIYNDLEGRFYSYRDGYRITSYNLPGEARKIILYGTCTVAGFCCKDDQTIASYLQKYLNDNGYTLWKVLNKGIIGRVNFFSRMFTDALSENDIVVIWIPEKWFLDGNIDKCVYQGNLTRVFLEIPSLIDNIADDYQHCNYKVNQKLAEQIYQDICASKLLDSPMQSDMPDRQQDYYIGWEIYMYFRDYFEQNDLYIEDDCVKTGAFVMTCDPFTGAHRIWIEEALKQVNKLYLFIAEDSNMQFNLDDRLRMAKSGVEGLSGVTVVPAGKYIFPNKLSRSIRKGKTDRDAMEYDCDIWGEVVAGQLGIEYRFIADEVEGDAMKEYHQAVKRILPNFGIKVIEFPRESKTYQQQSASRKTD